MQPGICWLSRMKNTSHQRRTSQISPSGLSAPLFWLPSSGTIRWTRRGVLYRWAAPGLLGDFVRSIEMEQCQIMLEDYTDGDVLTAGIQTAPSRSSKV